MATFPDFTNRQDIMAVLWQARKDLDYYACYEPTDTKQINKLEDKLQQCHLALERLGQDPVLVQEHVPELL